MEKMLACVTGLWLLCGAASAFMVVDQRPLSASDFVLGPFSLVEILGL